MKFLYDKNLTSTLKTGWRELTEDTFVGQFHFAKGSKYKAFETQNFGWIFFAPSARLVGGFTPARRIFKT